MTTPTPEWIKEFDRKYKDCEFGEFETDTQAIKSFIHHQLQKAREEWLRSEIEKLEREIAIHKQLASEWTGIDIKNNILHRINPHEEKVEALTSIITRYKEELSGSQE